MGTLIILAFFYMLPTIIAALRSHKDVVLIALVNLLLGWTLIFWLFAFILALTSNKAKETTVIVNNVNKE